MARLNVPQTALPLTDTHRLDFVRQVTPERFEPVLRNAGF
jgi:hypothetical protein